ncbi:tRNA U34 carboxymethyltransferase [Marinicella pacifica]|uniref:tRNA U34 carboxymethyltransferase n=1 Tax=Marinicella pacifica TaxID=1171543 RepID=A0A917CDH4_9GAMM|nr:tRNA 5-methoxyuridine(34)/uridine 5-oxyacetic acid(34) synthase CmoB [Marinicella pacifica]GGF83110.1 tRNA U34 carboxymethyltransferase [Marinicella pacifica]
MFKVQLNKLKEQVTNTELSAGFNQLSTLTLDVIKNINQGDLPRWQQAYENLPNLTIELIDLKADAITVSGSCNDNQKQQLLTSLETLIPWRKGPFSLFDVEIDAEWRSDMKWQRLLDSLPDLTYKTVLDVGCGNGYYLLKMAAYQPQVLLGIEPGILQHVQFWAVQKYAQTMATMLPLKIQQMPKSFPYFDVVFSMGVLYHRKSPIEHLEHLKSLLSPQGTLVLETLIVDGDEQTCLVPAGRYAQMRNVWFLPSVAMLSGWLEKVGFKNVEVTDVSITTTEEQRSTEWMRFHSLPQFLTEDENHTVEGHQPPKRAIFICQE